MWHLVKVKCIWGTFPYFEAWQDFSYQFNIKLREVHKVPQGCKWYWIRQGTRWMTHNLYKTMYTDYNHYLKLNIAPPIHNYPKQKKKPWRKERIVEVGGYVTADFL